MKCSSRECVLCAASVLYCLGCSFLAICTVRVEVLSMNVSDRLANGFYGDPVSFFFVVSPAVPSELAVPGFDTPCGVC